MAHYINNKEFVKLILIYKQTQNQIAYNEIGRNFIRIVKNQLRLPCFINYTDDRKSEMISDALFYMSKNLNRYDPGYGSADPLEGNPFAYFTMIAQRAFLQKIAEYKKRDAIFKPISYIDNIQSSVYRRSTTFRTGDE